MTDVMTAIIAILLIGAVLIFLWDHLEKKKYAKLMLRLRASKMYEQIFAIIVDFGTVPFDCIVVNRNAVLFQSMDSPPEIRVFDFLREGYRPLNNDRVLALSQVLAYDIEELQSNRCYLYRRQKEVQPNGETVLSCRYIAREAFKASVLRSQMMRQDAGEDLL